MYCIFCTEHVESGQIEPRALKKKAKTGPLKNFPLYDISSCYCNIKFNNWMILIEHTLILFPPSIVPISWHTLKLLVVPVGIIRGNMVVTFVSGMACGVM